MLFSISCYDWAPFFVGNAQQFMAVCSACHPEPVESIDSGSKVIACMQKPCQRFREIMTSLSCA